MKQPIKKPKVRLAPKGEFKVTYLLWKARKDKTGTCPVYIRSKQNNGDKQQLYKTSVRLHPQQWNKSKNEPKNKPAELLELETKLLATYRDLFTQGYEPTLADLLENMDTKRNTDKSTVVSWCDDYIESPKYSAGMKHAVSTLKSNIKDFNQAITFDRFRKPQVEKFFEHLTEQEVANNSQYKRFRALLNVARHANAGQPDLFNFEMPYSTQNALKVRLNWQEVKAVIKAEANTQVEQVAKDAFLLACFSGLRISDILSLPKGELHDYHYERLQTKTKQPVLVTIHKYNEKLFGKYIESGVAYTRQALSRSLKEVLKRAELTKTVTHTQQVGNHIKETILEKYKQISFHSGRRFYSRLLNDLGLGGEIARDELGHGFKSVTELYSGSPDHIYRVTRVRKAMEDMEKTMKQLSLMKVA